MQHFGMPLGSGTGRAYLQPRRRRIVGWLTISTCVQNTKRWTDPAQMVLRHCCKRATRGRGNRWDQKVQLCIPDEKQCRARPRLKWIQVLCFSSLFLTAAWHEQKFDQGPSRSNQRWCTMRQTRAFLLSNSGVRNNLPSYCILLHSSSMHQSCSSISAAAKLCPPCSNASRLVQIVKHPSFLCLLRCLRRLHLVNLVHSFVRLRPLFSLFSSSISAPSRYSLICSVIE